MENGEDTHSNQTTPTKQQGNDCLRVFESMRHGWDETETTSL